MHVMTSLLYAILENYSFLGQSWNIPERYLNSIVLCSPYSKYTLLAPLPPSSLSLPPFFLSLLHVCMYVYVCYYAYFER